MKNAVTASIATPTTIGYTNKPAEKNDGWQKNIVVSGALLKDVNSNAEFISLRKSNWDTRHWVRTTVDCRSTETSVTIEGNDHEVRIETHQVRDTTVVVTLKYFEDLDLPRVLSIVDTSGTVTSLSQAMRLMSNAIYHENYQGDLFPRAFARACDVLFVYFMYHPTGYIGILEKAQPMYFHMVVQMLVDTNPALFDRIMAHEKIEYLLSLFYASCIHGIAWAVDLVDNPRNEAWDMLGLIIRINPWAAYSKKQMRKEIRKEVVDEMSEFAVKQSTIDEIRWWREWDSGYEL